MPSCQKMPTLGKAGSLLKTGKASRWRGQPFVSVNVASFADSLLESELFGHERGAFTGAVNQHKGVFERANGGTLFLDEVGEMSLNMQVKLLRVLESSEYIRVGGSQTQHAKVRLITADSQGGRSGGRPDWPLPPPTEGQNL